MIITQDYNGNWSNDVEVMSTLAGSTILVDGERMVITASSYTEDGGAVFIVE